jgi:hypothetical protein
MATQVRLTKSAYVERLIGSIRRRFLLAEHKYTKLDKLSLSEVP